MDDLLLSLDQSTTNTGWALYRNKELIGYGAKKGKGSQNERINIMREWLIEVIESIDKGNPKGVNLKIVMEDIQLQHGDAKTFKTLARLQGVLINVLYTKDIPYDLCYASEWKSTCGIKGEARAEQKKNAKIYAENKYHLKDLQEDTCDAIGIGDHFLSEAVEVLNFE